MKTRVRTTSIEESNRFLRALWAEMRVNLPNHGWLYTPHRDGEARKIFLGLLDIGVPESPLDISISYEKRGCIQDLTFKSAKELDIEESSELGKALARSVDSALERANEPNELFIQSLVETVNLPLCDYVGDLYAISRVSKLRSILTIRVMAYDEIDAKAEFLRKALHFLNVLAVETNTPFWLSEGGDEGRILDKGEKTCTELFMDDPNWIDGVPVKSGCLVVSRAGKYLLDLILTDAAHTESIATFLGASNHFHTARKLDAQIFDRVSFGESEPIGGGWLSIPLVERDHRLEVAYQMGSTLEEITTVLYLSALEVAANIGIGPPQACSECGQAIYRIRHRVRDMTSRYLPEHAVRRFIIDNYDNRSKYLHTGSLLTDEPYVGVSIPQLDNGNLTGCKVPFHPSLLNIREFTGYCLRRTLYGLHDTE